MAYPLRETVACIFFFMVANLKLKLRFFFFFFSMSSFQIVFYTSFSYKLANDFLHTQNEKKKNIYMLVCLTCGPHNFFHKSNE